MGGIERAYALVSRITYPGFGYEIVAEGEAGAGTRFYSLRVVADGVDNETGEVMQWLGRKWRLSDHMTDGEIVQTAFLATMTAVEHEVRETFRFDGLSIFNPHYDLSTLCELRLRSDAIKQRDAT